MRKTKKLGILLCVCMMILTMGALVGCSGTDDSTDEDLQEDTSTTEDEMDIDVTVGSGETEESYSLDSSVLDESYLSSDDDSLLDSTEDSNNTE